MAALFHELLSTVTLSFSFSVSGGYDGSLAFLLVPGNFSKFGVSPKFLAVKFDADDSGSSIAVDVGGEIAARNSSPSDFSLALSSERRSYAWIDYDGASKMLEVRVSKSRGLRPEKALVSCRINLSNALWRDAMYVGISSSPRGNSTKTSNIYSWSFEVKHGVNYQMHSEPLDPESISMRYREGPEAYTRKGSPWKILVALLVGVVFGAFIASLVLFLRSKAAKRHPITPVEYPELDGEIGSKEIGFDEIKVVGSDAKEKA
ncbi:uncharacterized protein A4U43_C05F2670 [Asparagus officinalis]|uniref:Legume lectin domain-containing protein n=1 Tax=Asparagus officinalis TaxID=4686 RepID=A0A5P1ENU4_ASPOF|nr:L-type lectin-domain containing receptor kinase IV.3 isoform X2 [Asparagus officinalis]ONK67685.1 uncharacterized protein A4U43_C05F2670 [Asparagus officinalis]